MAMWDMCRKHLIHGGIIADKSTNPKMKGGIFVMSAMVLSPKNESINKQVEVDNYYDPTLENESIFETLERILTPNISINDMIHSTCETYQQAFEYFGVPWWVILFASAVGLRLAFLYPMLLAQKQLAMRARVESSAEGSALTTQIRALLATDNLASHDVRLNLETQRADLYKKVYPEYDIAKIVSVYLLNGGLFTYLFFCIRHLLTTQPLMHTGGVLWFTDLTVADPTYMLPLLVWVNQAVALQISLEYNPGAGELAAKARTTKTYAAVISHTVFLTLGLTVGTQLPAGILMFWLASSLCTLLQNCIVYNARFRRRYGMPEATSEPLFNDAQQQTTLPGMTKDMGPFARRAVPQISGEPTVKVFTSEEWQQRMAKKGSYKFKGRGITAAELHSPPEKPYVRPKPTSSEKNARAKSDVPST